MSQSLWDELYQVRNRPRLKQRIEPTQAVRLEQQLKYRAIWVEVKTVPPDCRDSKDLSVLATAIDGKANILVSGDDDLRADDRLRNAMKTYSIQLLGVNSFLKLLAEDYKN